MEAKIFLGGGCFWCIEAILKQLKGIQSLTSGYSNGQIKNPCYREVCTGMTGHAEVVEVVFNTEILSIEDLLIIFLTNHDPTTLNRQGADRGTQYRSIIAFEDASHRSIIDKVILQLQPYFKNPIVTEVTPIESFYPAEEYHQDYYQNNVQQSYCKIVIEPKLAKLRQHYLKYLKE